MEVVKEIVVFLENRPGTLARVCSALAERKISILGFALENSMDHGVIRMVVDEPGSALHLLGEHGMLCFENDILYLKLPNRSGALAEVTQALAKARVNLDYAYGSAGPRGRAHGMYLRIGNTKKAMPILSSIEGVE